MRKGILLLTLLATAAPAMSQTHLSGIVVDEQGNAMTNAAVVCAETKQGMATGTDGRFDIEVEQSTPLTVVTYFVGYLRDTTTVSSRAKASNIRISLQPDTTIVLDDVTSYGEKYNDNFNRVETDKALLVPNAAGGIEAALKTELGVSTYSELSSQYRVRGGNFDENMVYVNNIEIYRPFLIRAGEQEGLSFVNPDMVSSVQFSSGGFDASYGDRMSSVLSVQYKDPTEFHGSAAVSLLGASAHLEGSIGKAVSHITGLRYKTNRYLLGSLDTKGDYDPQFFDVQTFWTIRPCRPLSIEVLGYYASNKYDFEPEDRETTFGTLTDTRTLKIYFEGNESDEYQTGIAAVSVNLEPNHRNKVTLAGSIYRSAERENYDILGEYWLQQTGDDTENIGVGGYMQHARNELIGTIATPSVRGQHRVGKTEVTWGAKCDFRHFEDYVDEWEYTDSAGYVISPSTGEINYSSSARATNDIEARNMQFFAQGTTVWQFAKREGFVSLSYGVRAAHLSSNDEWIVSPRVSLRYKPKANRYFRFSAGRYSQFPLYREMQRSDGTLNEDVGAQKSTQFLLGFDSYFYINEHPFKFTTETYYKDLAKLNTYTIDNIRIRYAADNASHGYAYGLDLKLNGELADGVESWATLSFLKTEEDIDDDGAGYIPRPSDQRVAFSLFFQDCMPSNKSIGATLGMYFGTGLPFGPPDYPRKYATNRMPGYKRIDLGLFKDFALNTSGQQKWRNITSARLGIEVFNLFDFSNTISYFWISGVDEGQYAVPNYLTSRRINVRLSIDF